MIVLMLSKIYVKYIVMVRLKYTDAILIIIAKLKIIVESVANGTFYTS